MLIIKDFLTETDDEVKTILASDFKIEVVDTEFVPSFSDPAITYDRLDERVKRCKRLESCVLYVDIRNSATISAERQPQTLARMYSAFVRTMIKCARAFGGHVRNIIGDRVMVVFDRKDCFFNAVRTGILCQTVAQKIIDARIKDFAFKCGVGIDYGKMLIVKAGAIRRGDEMEFYRSLVWLGRPANVASKLTDIANKSIDSTTPGHAHVGRYYGLLGEWLWHDESYTQFVSQLTWDHSKHAFKHEDQYVAAAFDCPPVTTTRTMRPILLTKAVYDGYAAAVGPEQIKREGWAKQVASVPGYSGQVFGSNALFTADP